MCLIVTINGSPREGSRTGVLLQATAESVRRKVDQASLEVINLAVDWPEIFSGLTRQTITKRGEELVRLGEEADLVIVGSPVYRGTYTGLLKHYFDLVDRDAMNGKKAIIAATGSPLHGLMVDHQLRPLMAFFDLQTAGTGLYGVEADFDKGQIQSKALSDRVERAAREAAALLRSSQGAGVAVEAAQ